VPAKSKPWTWLLFGVNFGRARRGKLLGHMQVQTTARYARLAADPVKDSIRPPDRACSRSPPPAPLAAPQQVAAFLHLRRVESQCLHRRCIEQEATSLLVLYKKTNFLT